MDYRVIERGGQDYIMPAVGQSFTDNQRHVIAHTLRTNGYHVVVVSPGRIAITKKTDCNAPSLLALLG